MFPPEKRASQNQTSNAILTPHQSFACGKCQLPLKGKLGAQAFSSVAATAARNDTLLVWAKKRNARKYKKNL